jgi:hypothetical protein
MISSLICGHTTRYRIASFSASYPEKRDDVVV